MSLDLVVSVLDLAAALATLATAVLGFMAKARRPRKRDKGKSRLK